MSLEDLRRHSSDSSGSGSSTTNNLHQQQLELALFGSSFPVLVRSATVRRAKTSKESAAIGAGSQLQNASCSAEIAQQTRRSLDSASKLFGLDSISERKTKTVSSSALSRLSVGEYVNSLDSSSSECTDYAVRSLTDVEDHKNRTLTPLSPGSSYISWIESVKGEYSASAAVSQHRPPTDVDGIKSGEWNNFWLNYNSARCQRQRTHQSSEDKMSDDAKSSCSCDLNEQNGRQVALSLDEVSEAIGCTRRLTEILQSALDRAERANQEHEDDCNGQAVFGKDQEVQPSASRERSRSHMLVDVQELQKQKQQLKSTAVQSGSNSCINVLLNSTGVADILKRVIARRRDVIAADDTTPSMSRNSFSDWSTGNK